MPIEFACDCGKQFKVPDEYAGKRSKCPACGKMVTVPTPPRPGTPASVEETAEDAALRALTDGDDYSPAAPRMPGGYSGAPAGAAPTAPRPAATPPPEDAGSAASRALASQSALDKASRSKLRGKGKGKGKAVAQPSKGGIGIRFTISWVRLGIGGCIVAAGVVWLVMGLASMLGVIGKRFEVIWPSLFMAAGVVVALTGFIHLYDKKDPVTDDDE